MLSLREEKNYRGMGDGTGPEALKRVTVGSQERMTLISINIKSCNMSTAITSCTG